MRSPRNNMLCALFLASCALAPRLACAGPIDVAAVLPGPPPAGATGSDGSGRVGASAFARDDAPLPREAQGPGATFAPLPEPGSVAIMAAGLGLAGFVVRRRRSGKLREN